MRVSGELPYKENVALHQPPPLPVIIVVEWNKFQNFTSSLICKESLKILKETNEINVRIYLFRK